MKGGAQLDSESSAIHHWKLIGLCLAGLVFSCLLLGRNLRDDIIANSDFQNFYAGGRLAFSGRLYDPESVMSVQREVTGTAVRSLMFSRPPFYAAAFWPLAQLPYRLSFAIWESLMLSCLAAFVWIWPFTHWRHTAIACCWSLPLAFSFVLGQDLPLVLLAVTAAFRLLLSKRLFAAGMVLAVCAIKPHLFLLLPLLIVGSRLWPMAGGLLTGGAALTIVSFFAGGFRWPLEFLRNALSQEITPMTINTTLHGLAKGNLAIELSLAGAVALATWVSVRRGGVQYGFAAILVGGSLAAHHAYLQDWVITLPALLLILARSAHEWQRLSTILLLAPLIYAPLLNGVPAVPCLVMLAFAFSMPFAAGRFASLSPLPATSRAQA